jgi:cardiolipin synthase
MRIQILVDANQFWASLQDDIRTATQYVYIESLSFEGDKVGNAVSHAMVEASAPDRRVIADEFFWRYCINDRFLYNPRHWFNSEIRRERDQTMAMLDGLNANRVQVKLSSPSGPLFAKVFDRNHKKIIVIDDKISYLGGMNFSEHNFDWHDMMLRIEGADIARFLRDDFLSTWNGENLDTPGKFDDIQIYRFDGKSNEKTFGPILGLIAGARESVYVESPYISYPFFENLRQARRNGANVVLITPGKNNWRGFKEYTIWESNRSGIDVREDRGRMTHLKAILIDDRYLIVGSSSFDFMSYQFYQEIIAVVEDKSAISQFRKRVLMKDLESSSRPTESVGDLGGYCFLSCLKILSWLCKSVAKVLALAGWDRARDR